MISDGGTVVFRDGEPCGRHRNCLSHVNSPCEGCGRIAGGTRIIVDKAEYDKLKKFAEYIADYEPDNPTKYNPTNAVRYLISVLDDFDTRAKAVLGRGD